MAWEGTTAGAHANAMGGTRADRATSALYKQYKVGDQFYRKHHRVPIFKSVQEKETYMINLKLQARHERPYGIISRVSAVLYVADIDGV